MARSARFNGSRLEGSPELRRALKDEYSLDRKCCTNMYIHGEKARAGMREEQKKKGEICRHLAEGGVIVTPVCSEALLVLYPVFTPIRGCRVSRSCQ